MRKWRFSDARNQFSGFLFRKPSARRIQNADLHALGIARSKPESCPGSRRLNALSKPTTEQSCLSLWFFGPHSLRFLHLSKKTLATRLSPANPGPTYCERSSQSHGICKRFAGSLPNLETSICKPRRCLSCTWHSACQPNGTEQLPSAKHEKHVGMAPK